VRASQDPSVVGVGILDRGVIHGIRSPTSSCKEGEEVEEEEEGDEYKYVGFVFRDIVWLIRIALYLLFIIQLIKRSINSITGM
jgi:hypothetical protein